MSTSKSRFNVVEIKNDGECAIVSLKDEDHTLANALRSVYCSTAIMLGIIFNFKKKKKIGFSFMV